MSILIVTATRLPVKDFKIGEFQLFFRSSVVGLHCLAADVVVLGPGLTNEQRALAAECSCRGDLYHEGNSRVS